MVQSKILYVAMLLWVPQNPQSICNLQVCKNIFLFAIKYKLRTLEIYSWIFLYIFEHILKLELCNSIFIDVQMFISTVGISLHF